MPCDRYILKLLKAKKTPLTKNLPERTEALELLQDIKDIKDINQLTVEDVVVMFAYAEAIVETVREPLVILNEDLHIKTANKAFFEMFRVKKNDTYNKSIFDLGNGQWDAPALKKLLLEVLPQNSVFNDYEVVHDFEDIGERCMVLNARRIVLEGHKTELILLAIEDVTDTRKLESEKDDFIAMASHELKTPLTTIKILVHLMQQMHKTDPKSEAVTNKINVQIQRLTSMMGSFLNVYSIQSGKMEVNKNSFSIDKCLREEIETFQYSTQTHTISLLGAKNVKVFADKERISQVIANFLSNAIKYSPTGNKVVVKMKKTTKEAIVSVQDFGMGIAHDQQEKVFERFYRTNGKHEKNIKGLGLGLYIASEIIKSYGGKIWLKSKLNQGSTFFFSLPIGKKKVAKKK